MSENNTCAGPNDAAIETVRERIALIDAQIEARARDNATDAATRDVLLDLIATLSRKPRARKASPAKTDAPARSANDTPETPASRSTVFAAAATSEPDAPGTFPPGTFGPRPSVFGAPANDASDVAEAA